MSTLLCSWSGKLRLTDPLGREIGGSQVSQGTTDGAETPPFDRRLALLLAMAMFVLVSTRR